MVRVVTRGIEVTPTSQEETEKIKRDSHGWNENFSKGFLGVAIFLREFSNYLHKKKFPCTIYLYGRGVLSNELADLPITEGERPDLIICRHGKIAGALIEVKYQDFREKYDYESALKMWKQYQPGGPAVECIEQYLAYGGKASLPCFWVAIDDCSDKPLIRGLKLSEEVKGLIQPQTIMLPFKHFKTSERLFEAICSVVKSEAES